VFCFSPGIPLDSVSIVEAGSQEFQKVSGKFQQAWARGKGSCPTLSFVFVVSNRKLVQRWTAYRQQLSIQVVEEHYHGTVLMCDIINTKAMCSTEECGVCGISRDGFDRRCIRKNINFQRFGHDSILLQILPSAMTTLRGSSTTGPCCSVTCVQGKSML